MSIITHIRLIIDNAGWGNQRQRADFGINHAYLNSITLISTFI